MAVTLKGQTAVYEGTSTDTKPTDADNNAIFKELDTGIRYYYDGTDWNEIPSSGGGGGGGTGTDNYNDLNNKPSINGTTLSGNKSLDNLGIQAKLTFDSAPTEDSENPVTSGGVYTALATNIQGIKVNGSTVNPDSNKVVSITVPTSAADVSALPNTTKYAAALKLTINSSTFVMTGQLKDQDDNNLGTAQTIDLPLESVVVGGKYDSQTKKVILTLQNGNTIAFSVADLVSGLQTELSASNKLNPAYINYDSTHRAVSDTEKSTWNGKQNALSFDGTYSASTNKAATVSTVTNAVNALDVTGDASVSASKTISAWSETDGKVSISTQDIAIAGTQTTLTGYAKSSTAGKAVAATDNVNQAIGKLEATIDDNKNNILYNTNNGVKNTFDFANAPQEANVYTTVSKTATSLTVTANNPSEGSSSVVYSGKDYPAGNYIFSCKITDYSCTTETARIYIATSTAAGTGVANKTITGNGTIQIPFHWNGGKVYVKYFPNESNIINQSNTFTASENMIMLASVSDITYQPYAMSNAELTAAIQALQAQLANQ